MKRRLLLVVSFLSFVTLGLPDGMLGVAWPSISAAFGRPLGSLGVLMFGFTVGYITTTGLLGTIIARFGYAAVMTAASVSISIGALGLMISPWWYGVIAAITCIGIGSGLLDGGLNAYGAAFFRPRDLNWLHAFYGVGAALGPAIMTPLVVAGTGWRSGYGVLFVASSAIIVAFFVTRRSWQSRNEHGAGQPQPYPSENTTNRTNTPAPLDARTRLVAIGSVMLFFLYTGIEVVAGQWAFSLFTIQRGVAMGQAGAWVGIYWAALTLGRIVFGWVSERVAVLHILRGALCGAALGIALLLPRSIPILAPIGLAILGFSLAPMFPLLIGETPRRVGARLADHLIGFQIAAANLGAVSLIAVVGLGVELISLEVVPWALGALFLTFAALHEVVARLSMPRQAG